MSKSYVQNNQKATMNISATGIKLIESVDGGAGSTGIANPFKLISLEVEPLSKDAIEVQPTRGARKEFAD